MNRKPSPVDVERDGLLALDPMEKDNANGFHKSVSSASRPRGSRAMRLLSALLPSFMTTQAANAEVKPAALHSSTLYLDGLRGYASICVLNSHVVTAFSNAPQMDFGWGDGMFLTPFSLPIIRLLYSGPGMVTLFFLVSGFSCCLKPLEAMASRDPNSQGKVLRNLSTSLMRRWFRLFLPVIACTFMITMFVHFGGFRSMDYFMGDPHIIHEPIRYIKQQPTLHAQLKVWVDDLWDMLNIWNLWPNGDPATGYYAPFTNPHMWFITVEFKASLILYCSLLGLAVAQPTQRFLAFMLFALYMFLAAKDEILPYFFGACLAHMKLTIDAQRSPPLGGDKAGPGSIPHFLRPLVYGHTRGFPRLVWTASVVASLWLMSTPAWSYHGPCWYVFTLVTPSAFVRQQTLMQLVGVSGLLLCLMTSTPQSIIRRFLTSPLALYLGRISFAVYIIHGPVLLAVGYSVPVAIWKMFADGPLAWLGGVLACEAVTIVLSIWLGDVFNRQIESRCGSVTKRIETWMTTGR